jgi:hypothetical protein
MCHVAPRPKITEILTIELLEDALYGAGAAAAAHADVELVGVGRHVVGCVF